jgi:protein-S-isoprenylcysteine O-methyltransferase Ste14
MSIPLLCKLAFLAVEVGWYAIRIPHNRRARRVPVASSQWDLRENLLLSISALGLGVIPTAYCLFGFAKLGERAANPFLLAIGVLVAALSLLMFDKSHRGLGREWSFSLELRESHRLKTQGVYAWVRHPMYSAFWLWALAQAILLPNWIAGLSGLLGFGCLYAFRVPREERMMQERFGDEWLAYAAATPRVVPWKVLTGRG